MSYAARFLDPRRPTRDRRLERAVRAAASRLLAPEGNRAAAAALAERGGRIVGLGDSMTADALSWIEILRCAVRGVEWVNLGVSGDTTVHLVGRFEQVTARDPDLLIVMAGTNDARRHGAAAARMLVPDPQTRSNLALIRALAAEQTRAGLVFVTPPPILEARVRRAPLLVREAVTWLEADIARKAALVRSLDADVVDSAVPISPPLERLLLADGLHLSLLGQERLAGFVLRSVARAGPGGSRR